MAYCIWYGRPIQSNVIYSIVYSWAQDSRWRSSKKDLCVRSGWTLSRWWSIWIESPRNHEFEFRHTFRVAGKRAPEKQKPQLLPWYSYIWCQTLKPLASLFYGQRKLGGKQTKFVGVLRNFWFLFLKKKISWTHLHKKIPPSTKIDRLIYITHGVPKI